MKFVETKLKGSFIIEIEKLEDERGFFARSWDREKFEEVGINPNISQCSVSHNNKKGTLRGMHFQAVPYEEAKTVSCVKGMIYDIIIDLRPGSSTLYEWIGVELSDQNHKMLYVPEGFAHGFQALMDDTDVFYQISEVYKPDYSRGIRWDDPFFRISWPIIPPIISKKDLCWKLFKKLIDDQ